MNHRYWYYEEMRGRSVTRCECGQALSTPVLSGITWDCPEWRDHVAAVSSDRACAIVHVPRAVEPHAEYLRWQGEVDELAQEMAFVLARTDIESFCGPTAAGCEYPYNTADVDGEDERLDVERACRYLTLRGMLERHPEHNNWVRIAEGIA